MVEPVDHTLRILQEIRGAVRTLDARVAAMDDKIDRNYHVLSDKMDRNCQIHQKRLNGLQMAMQGKTFADLCTIARFDERISALEKRVSRPRKPK